MSKKKLLIIISCVMAFLIMGSAVFYYAYTSYQNKQEQKRRLQIVQQYYDDKIALYESQNSSLNNVDVTFIGDSLTDGYDLEHYYPQYTTANRGIGGDTTFGVENRLKVSLYDIQPKVVVMLIGGNNIYTMFENYESILQQLKTNLPTSQIVLLSLTAMGKDWAKNNNQAIINNQKIKSLAIKYDYTFVDLFTPLCNVETGQIFDEYSNDGAHFTTTGFEVVTDVVSPVLQGLLGR